MSCYCGLSLEQIKLHFQNGTTESACRGLGNEGPRINCNSCHFTEAKPETAVTTEHNPGDEAADNADDATADEQTEGDTVDGGELEGDEILEEVDGVEDDFDDEGTDEL
ncbi:hypothetical protein scyTo_0018523 [Scyliorhinus torazame]|uniref:Uncharacterized protein n=1 Tax=Scyliorhinus torazame TaxID=75743 RepID=A0A401PXJ2_SCYTO|nr:hypothetical protein [Scyliorhinus torazame]